MSRPIRTVCCPVCNEVVSDKRFQDSIHDGDVFTCLICANSYVVQPGGTTLWTCPEWLEEELNLDPRDEPELN